MSTVQIAILGMAISLAAAATANAQVTVDMSKVTCQQMLSLTPNSVEAVIWLSGYYNGLKKNTMLDLNQFKQNAEVVAAECRSNPTKTVMQTVETLLKGK